MVEKPKFSRTDFEPSGPVGSRFIKSEGPIDLIRGPWGSGKTVNCVFKGPYHASQIFPVCRDGWIHVKQAAIRDTYREMAKTALSSWHEFYPKNGPFTKVPIRENYTGGSDRPVVHVLEWKVIRRWPHGLQETPVRFEMEFGAIGDQNLDSFFKGYEISIGWMNECDLLHADVPGRFYGRTGRYPPRAEIMEWEGERLGWETDEESGIQVVRLPRIVYGDFNPPDESNWTHKREIEEPEKWPSYNFFAQPSGLSPNAENRRGKPRSAYEEEEQAFGVGTPDALRNVHGEYAAKADGTPVYLNKFSVAKHKSDSPLDPVRELPFYMGFDAGGTPAAVIGQFMPNGQYRGLREICSPTGEVTGPSRFGEMVLNVLMQDFKGMACAGAWGDPSAWYGVDRVAGELAFMELVSQIISIPILPTHTNDVKSRIEAVELSLRDIDIHTPGAIYDPRMVKILRGFASQYKLTKHGSESKTDTLAIVKNEYSHPHDAEQYLHLGYRGYGLTQQGVEVVRGANVVPINRPTPPTGPAKSIWDT